MNMQLELISFVGEERRSRLLAEAAQMRLLKAGQADWTQTKTREAVSFRQKLVTTWRWLVQTISAQHPPAQSGSGAEHVLTPER